MPAHRNAQHLRLARVMTSRSGGLRSRPDASLRYPHERRPRDTTLHSGTCDQDPREANCETQGEGQDKERCKKIGYSGEH
jgi:hypothetical protein